MLIVFIVSKKYNICYAMEYGQATDINRWESETKLKDLIGKTEAPNIT